jgi:hypothetical protein
MRISRPFAVAFLVGLTSMLQVKVIGYFGMVELFFVALAPWYLYTRWRTLLSGRLRPFIFLALAWLWSALLTDLVRGTALGDMLRGNVSIVLWIACLICQYVMLRGRPEAIKWYTLGLACSFFISLYYFRPGSLVWLADLRGTSAADETNWQSAYANVANAAMAAALLFGFRRYPRQLTVALVLYALLCLVLGSRGLFVIHMLAGAMTFYFYRERQRAQQRASVSPPSLLKRLRLLALMGTLAVLAMFGYVMASSRGWLGAVEQVRYQQQSEANIGVLSARYDSICGALAIIDSPLIGHGSWAEDTAGYRARGLALIGLPPAAAAGRLMQGGPIPGHSHIITAWVFHGVLGGLYWVFVLGFLIRYMVRYLPGPPEYLPYILISVISLSWNILASPFGQRPATAASLVFLIVCAEAADRQRRSRLQAGCGSDTAAPAPDADEPTEALDRS